MGEWPPQYADARTLEGKLQRGLGAGFLGALDAPREIAHAALMGCITVDPRWDHQIDDREWYYGELAFRTELPVGPIADALRDWGTADEAGDSWVATDVLGHLAERGNADASAVLRDYVTWGPWWDSALYGLRAAGEPDWRSLIPSLLRKARDERTGSYFLVRPPFSIWAEFDDSARAMVEDARRRNAANDLDRESWKTLETKELLVQHSGRSHRFIERILAGRTSASDKDALHAALDSSSAYTRAMAALALTRQGETCLATAIEIAARPQKPPFASAIAREALVSETAERALRVAREWRTSRSWLKRRAAWEVLARHATAADKPWVEARLVTLGRSGAKGVDETYALAEIVSARFAGHEFPMLGRRFDTFPYSYGRHYLAEALAVTDPTFPTTRAFTALWDCEAATRVVAATHVSLAVPGAVERLRELAADPLEDHDAIRQVVARRLGADSPHS